VLRRLSKFHLTFLVAVVASATAGSWLAIVHSEPGPRQSLIAAAASGHLVPSPATISTTTVAPTTTTVAPTTTTAPPTTVIHPAPVVQVATTVVHPVVRAPAPPPAPAAAPAPPPSTYGCGPALAYLASHAAPGFSFECPGYADGRQAMTCINIAGLCPGERLIAIAVPCAAAYMNEASNSWVLIHESSAPIDPYGYCQ